MIIKNQINLYLIKMQNNVLIYDIECATYGNSMQNIEKHKLKYFGCYSYRTKKYYFLSDRKQIQEIINDHKILVGFNNKLYDNVILLQEKFNLQYKVFIDLYRVIKQRQDLIKFKGKILTHILNSMSLNNILKTLELVTDEESKLEIDYTLLDKINITVDELLKIEKYTTRDIELTKKLFEFINEKFDSWKHYLTDKDKYNFKHIGSAPSVYAYKVLANKVGFREEYTNVENKQYQGEGGYVSYPSAEKVVGNIYCLDFTSLYPHIMIQCNLFGRIENSKKGWTGNNVFNTIGTYNNKKHHKISSVLMNIFNERKKLKDQNDLREHGLKIVLNICYGLLRNETFTKIYDNIAGKDCCLIGQQWIKLARKRFAEKGYNVIYTDTDSVYIQDLFQNKEKILEIKNNIINEIKNNIPFPVNTFDMDIDYEIDMIHFFKGGHEKRDDELDKEDIKNKKLGLMKKNYLFIYNDKGEKKVYIKNLGIVKRTNSPLSKKIFWEKIAPIIIKTNECKFTTKQIKKWIDNYLKEDITLITKRIVVKNKNEYKSQTCIQVQAYDYLSKKNISNTGIYFFIPNNKIGIGKGNVKYCLMDEFNEKLNMNDLSLYGVMKELIYFNNDFNYNFFKLNQINDNCKQETLI